MATELSPRRVYQSSGRVDWLRFIPLALVTLVVALGMACCLSELFERGFYYPIIVPFLAAMPVLWVALIAIGVGRCRSRFVATAFALLAAASMYLGYYDVCLARVVGVDNALRPDLAVPYLNWRMETDQIRHAGDPALPAQNGSDEPLNWAFFVGELVAVSAILIVTLRRRARRAFCEECGRWATRATMKLPVGSSRRIFEMLQTGTLDSLHRTAMGNVEWAGNAEAAVEYCDHGPAKAPACPVFFSIRDHVKHVDRPVSLGEKLGSYFQFRWNYQTVDVLRQVALAPSEVASVASSFAGLKRALSPADGPLGRSADETRPVPAPPVLSTGPIVTVEPVPEEFAGTILTPSHAITQTVIGLLPLVILFGGGYAGFTFAEKFQNPLALFGTIGVLLVFCVLLLKYSTYLTTRYMRGITSLAFAHRPDCWLDIREPGLLFVDIVPRSNWGKGMMESAEDIGFLQVDEEHRQLIFEGDKERYRIPAEAITDCKIESYTSGAGNSRTFYFMVVVSGNTATGPWETWFWQRHPDLRPYGKNRRQAVAQELEARIRAMKSAAGLAALPVHAV
jgi:hypothetical protein